MTPPEQLVAAGLGVANVGVSAWIATVVTNNQALVLLAGLLASALTVVGGRVGSRLLALAGLFASTLISGNIYFPVAMPYYAGAFWIFLKYNRLTKAQASLRRQQRAEQRGTTGAGPGAGRSSARKGKGGPAKIAGKAPPPKSKRYTPPKTKKKRTAPPAKPPKDRSIVD